MPPVQIDAQRLRLADHVRACRVDDQVILLDLNRGNYLGIGGPQLHALSSLISDWPAADLDPVPQADAGVLAGWIEPLQRQHLLTDAPGHQAPRVPLAEPVDSLDIDDEPQHPVDECRQLLQLWHTTIITTLWLRRRSLTRIAADLADMRGRDAEPVDVPSTRLRATVSTYTRLRPFVFTAHDRCLHDSLTLVRFLAARNLSARWVIGVRTRPFMAHSWVQSGGLVLNDLAENVRRYQPILVV